MNKPKHNYHPGVYVKEMIFELDMTQTEFAKRVGVSEKFLSTVLSGESKMTFEFAYQLAQCFGTDVHVWMKLQTIYDLNIHAQEHKKEVEEDLVILKHLDQHFFIQQDIFKQEDDRYTRLSKLKQALSVSRLSLLRERDFYSLYRKSGLSKDLIQSQLSIASSTWLSVVMAKARTQGVQDFDEILLREALPRLRVLSLEDKERQVESCRQILATCGVKLITVPYLKQSHVNGLVRWNQSATHVLVALSDKGHYQDVFWFSLFHELGHVLQLKKRMIILDDTVDVLEKDADQFAQDVLIHPEEYQRFIKSFKHTQQEVLDFAHQQKIHPGLVVGRLHHDHMMSHQAMNHLREKLMFE